MNTQNSASETSLVLNNGLDVSAIMARGREIDRAGGGVWDMPLQLYEAALLGVPFIMLDDPREIVVPAKEGFSERTGEDYRIPEHKALVVHVIIVDPDTHDIGPVQEAIFSRTGVKSRLMAWSHHQRVRSVPFTINRKGEGRLAPYVIERWTEAVGRKYALPHVSDQEMLERQNALALATQRHEDVQKVVDTLVTPTAWEGQPSAEHKKRPGRPRRKPL